MLGLSSCSATISLGVFRPSPWSFSALGIALAAGPAQHRTVSLAERASNFSIELELSL